VAVICLFRTSGIKISSGVVFEVVRIHFRLGVQTLLKKCNVFCYVPVFTYVRICFWSKLSFLINSFSHFYFNFLQVLSVLSSYAWFICTHVLCYTTASFLLTDSKNIFSCSTYHNFFQSLSNAYPQFRMFDNLNVRYKLHKFIFTDNYKLVFLLSCLPSYLTSMNFHIMQGKYVFKI